MDAVALLQEHKNIWPERTLIYLDPPYYIKGHHLYYHHYASDDHTAVRDMVLKIDRQKWIVSYDDVPAIRSLYSGQKFLRYALGYSARTAASGAEIMFFGNDVSMPKCCSTMTELERGMNGMPADPAMAD